MTEYLIFTLLGRQAGHSETIIIPFKIIQRFISSAVGGRELPGPASHGRAPPHGVADAAFTPPPPMPLWRGGYHCS